MSQDQTETTPVEGEELKAQAEVVDDAGQLAEEQEGLAEEQNETASLKAELDRVNAELADSKDQFIRKVAEMENFRKRLLRDKEEAVLFANRNLLTDLVQIIDDFERAIKSSEAARDFDALHNGVAMIEQQFTSMLDRKYGLKRFDSVGQEFDPVKHEAVMMEPNDEFEVSTVLADFQRGYILHDKVIRTSKVKVSNPSK